MIYFTSDLHLCHDKDFIYAARGFSCIEDHDAALVRNWNSVVSDDDEVYILGDLVLKDTEKGIGLLKQLKGRIRFIRGNHDSDRKMELYTGECGFEYLGDAGFIRLGGRHYFLCHYPAITANADDWKRDQIVFCLFGHTHQKVNTYGDLPNMYHVGVDSHSLFPVSLEEIRREIDERYR